MMHPSAFDLLAPDYDARFTAGTLGSTLRRAVWRWLDSAFSSDMRVLELNCGTGEDALHLAGRGVRTIATDGSTAMLDVARAKVGSAQLWGTVEFRHMPIERLGDLAAELGGALDGAFSNFGGLNCVANLALVAQSMAVLLKPGAPVVLCVMGPVALWEWAWFLARGRPASAFRRLVPGGVAWRGLSVRYPSLRSLKRVFAPWFTVRRAGGVGVFVPPTYAESWARRHPRLIERLDRWERRIEEWSIMPWLGDHYVVELARR